MGVGFAVGVERSDRCDEGTGNCSAPTRGVIETAAPRERAAAVLPRQRSIGAVGDTASEGLVGDEAVSRWPHDRDTSRKQLDGSGGYSATCHTSHRRPRPKQ